MAEILVTNPSTEDSWRLDNRYIIRWENFGVTGNVRISLRESSGGTEALEIDDNVYNTGFYLWEIPSPLDIDTDYFTNEVCLNWNSSLVFLTAVFID